MRFSRTLLIAAASLCVVSCASPAAIPPKTASSTATIETATVASINARVERVTVLFQVVRPLIDASLAYLPGDRAAQVRSSLSLIESSLAGARLATSLAARERQIDAAQAEIDRLTIRTEPPG